MLRNLKTKERKSIFLAKNVSANATSDRTNILSATIKTNIITRLHYKTIKGVTQ